MKRVMTAVAEDIDEGIENKCMFSLNDICDLLIQIEELDDCKLAIGINENDILVFEVGNVEYPVTHEDRTVLE